MKLTVKDMDIATGGPVIAILNQNDAQKFDLHHGDRISIKYGKKKAIAVIDIAESKKAVPIGKIGLFEETLDKLNVKHNAKVDFDIEEKPKSVQYIKNKLEGTNLKANEINAIVADIVSGNLDSIEIAFFVSACYTRGLNLKESIYLTKAIVNHGDRLNIKKKIVMDKHCTGGVPANRTTMVVVPIIAAAGITIPKTSSRSITSPAGTADTMEVLAPVTLPVKKMEKIIKKCGGCMVWGGAMNLAAADDKMIKIRHPLSLDPEGMLLASILAKKAAVSSTHVLIDIPLGPDTKIKTKKQAMHLKRKFIEIGAELGMKIKVIITNGNEPIGNGIGPILEAKDVLYTLMNDPRQSLELRKKSIHIAAVMLELAGKKNAKQLATEILDSGKAYKKMKEIIKCQGGNPNIKPEDLKPGKFTYAYKSPKDGIIYDLDNREISRIARIAGAPVDAGAGMYLYKHENQKVKKGEPIMTIYAHSKTKLDYAVSALKRFNGIRIK